MVIDNWSLNRLALERALVGARLTNSRASYLHRHCINMRLLILSTIILLSACSKTDVDAEYSLYVSNFERLWGKSVTNLIVKSKDLDCKEGEDGEEICLAGKCKKDREQITNTIVQRTIYIDPQIWDQSCEYQKEATMFHELGHCFLNRKHVDHDSYMLERLQDCDFYREKRGELIEEIFNGPRG